MDEPTAKLVDDRLPVRFPAYPARSTSASALEGSAGTNEVPFPRGTTMTTKTIPFVTTLLATAIVLSACDSEQDLASDQELLTAELDADSTLQAPAGQATPVAGATYQCQIDVNSAWTDCDPALVDAVEHDPGEWRADVIMAQAKVDFRRIDIFAEVCDPVDYAFSVSDSPTANGWGGDSGTTDHDAEAFLYGAGLHFFSTTDFLHGAFGNNSSLGNAHAGGCQTTHTVVYHEAGVNVGVLNYAGGGSPLAIRDTQGFKLDYTKCPGGASDPSRGVSCDYEDAARNDEGHWYFGLNRTVGSGSRDGTGVKRACVVLNDDVSVVPADCLQDPPPVSVPPEGTRKFCIDAGTPADMLAQCEGGAQVWVDLFTNGTYDYVTQWGNPCPAGTSIVPGSYYYVPNSCNPLPDVGVGCSGPGSFNYEFQIGVQCQ